MQRGGSVLQRNEGEPSALLFCLRSGDDRVLAAKLLHSAWQQEYVLDVSLNVLFFDFILERINPENELDLHRFSIFAKFAATSKSMHFVPADLREEIHLRTIPDDIRQRIEFSRLVISSMLGRMTAAGEDPKHRKGLSGLLAVHRSPWAFANKLISLHEYAIPRWIQVKREWEQEDAEFATADEWSIDSEIDIEEDAEFASLEGDSSEPEPEPDT